MKTFCCCFSLRVGTLVIGTQGLIGFFCKLIYSITSLVEIKTEHDPANRNSTEFDQGLLVALVILAIVGLLINGLLIAGVEKKITNLMLPWIILYFLGSAVLTVAALLRLYAVFTVTDQPEARALETFSLVVYCKYSWYSSVRVYNYYNEIRDEQAIATSGVQFAHRMDNETTDYKDGASPI